MHRLLVLKPYDSEVEYLESDGLSCIDLGFQATEVISFTLNVYRPSNSVRWDCGAEEGWSSKIARLLMEEGSGKYAVWRFGTSGTNNMTSTSNCIGDLRLRVNGKGVSIDNLTTGVTYNNAAPSASAFTTPYNFCIFGFGYNNGPSISSASAGSRFKSGIITDNGVNLDLIAVRKGQVGYLYDKISGKLFGNVGTGSFTLGPDISSTCTKAVIINPPYDAEIEYIRAVNVNAYIDTGIECTGDLSIECSFAVHDNQNTACAGGYTGDNDGFRHQLIGYYAGSGIWDVAAYQTASMSTPNMRWNNFSANTYYVFKLNADAGAWYINGTQLGTITPISSNITTGRNYGLMARINSDGTIARRNSSFAWCKLSRNGILLRDLIPVRVGQVGYMYDKVSGRLFGNAGTGSFTLGPDIVKDKRKALLFDAQPVYYQKLKFDGNSCIQTDVTLPEDGSITVGLAEETLKSTQHVFNFLTGGSSGYTRFLLGGATNSSNRQMVPYYDSTSYLVSNRVLSWNYSGYSFFMTSKGMGWGDNYGAYTKGSSHPTGGLCLGNISNNSSGQGFTGTMSPIKIYSSSTQNNKTFAAFDSYTPVATLYPCKVGDDSGLMWIEEGIFYRKTGGTGTVSVEGNIVTL